MDHIGQNAELYALGALSDDEREQVEAHARDCISCMKLLGNAERIVSDVELELPPLDPPPRLEARILKSARADVKAERTRPMQYRGALMALLVLGTLSLILGIRNLQADRQLRGNGAILAALSSNEFGYISLRASATTAPIAKAICEEDGKWIYLIVAKPSPDLTLYGERNGHRELLGRPVSEGQSATLFVEGPGKFTALELIAYGRVVAEAKTHYPK